MKLRCSLVVTLVMLLFLGVQLAKAETISGVVLANNLPDAHAVIAEVPLDANGAPLPDAVIYHKVTSKGEFSVQVNPRQVYLAAFHGQQGVRIPTENMTKTVVVDLVRDCERIIPAGSITCTCTKVFWNFYHVCCWNNNGYYWCYLSWGCKY